MRWSGNGVVGRRRWLLIGSVIAALALSACAAHTTGTTGVTATSADLHATARCAAGESCTWYWQYWPAAVLRSSSRTSHVFGPAGPTRRGSVPLTWHVDGLDPSTTYRWVFCGSNDGGAAYACTGPRGRFSAPSADPPSDYQRFRTAPGDWKLQVTPTPAGARRSSLDGVSCPSAFACTAVGSYINASGTEMTLAERRSQRAWSVMPTPNPEDATASRLERVSCASRSACIAVGYFVSAGATIALAERWDGSAWTILSVPTPAGARWSRLSGISCTSVSTCTAVGYYSTSSAGGTLAERWDGVSWTIRPAPISSGGGGDLTAVSCPSATQCNAVGYPPALGETWDETSGTLHSMPAQVGGLLGTACSSASACVAVGLLSPLTHFQNTVVTRWDGTAWSVDGSYTSLAGALDDVSCVSTTACVAVGGSGQVGRPSDRLAQRWDGSTWTTQSVQVPATASVSALYGVSCLVGSRCIAVGVYGTGHSNFAFAVSSVG